MSVTISQHDAIKADQDRMWASGCGAEVAPRIHSIAGRLGEAADVLAAAVVRSLRIRGRKRARMRPSLWPAILLALGIAMLGLVSSAGAAAPGIVVAWGHNGYGQLGEGTMTNSSTPAQVKGIGGVGALTGVVEVAGGGSHSLALRSDGSVVAWGQDTAGQLGDGTTTNSTTPVRVKGVGGTGALTGVVAIAGGGYHSLALRSDGSVVAWGYNNDGELGHGTSTNSSTPVQVKGVGGTGTLTGVVAIAAGYDKSLALRSDGSLIAWGNNPGDGTTNSSTPVQVKGVGGTGALTEVVAIAGGGYHSLALRSDGSVVAWGVNTAGQLGDGTTTNSLTPVQVKSVGATGTLTGVVSLAAGFEHSVALRSRGSVVAWGYNGYGQLGDGTTTNSQTPVQVKGVGGSGTLAGVVSLAGGGSHSLALHSGGSVVAWGDNGYGQLGNGTTSNSPTPVPVLGIGGSGTLTGVVALAPEDYAEHSLAVQGAFASLTPARIAFGSQLAGTATAIQTVTLTNSGPAPLIVSGETLSGAGATAFQRRGDGCAGATLAADSSCQVALRFIPSRAGEQSAALAFETTAANALGRVVLSGIGLAHFSLPPRAPVLSALTISPRSFRAGPSGPTALAAAARTYGTLVSYRDSEAAITTFSVQRTIAGAHKGGRCLTRPKRARKGAKRCTLYQIVRRFTHTDKAGINRLRFTGRVNRHKLPPGSYRLQAIARNSGRTSKPRLVSFQIRP
jgi:alpha-tubulin suppressor-like RCC1 family protein